MSQSSSMMQGSVRAAIVRFALPYMFAYLLQIFYGLVDLFVIGLYCGVASTTSVSIGSQVMHMLTVVIVGLAMGSTVTIARATGADDDRRASTAIGNTASLFLFLSVVLAIVLFTLTGNVVSLMSTPAEAVVLTEDYLSVCFAGIPFITTYNIIAAIFRGFGDSRTPLYFVAVACIVNVVADFALIGGLGLDAIGAAYATVLSQAVSVLLSLIYIRYRGFGPMAHSRPLRATHLRPERETMRRILGIGLPVALQDGFVQIAFLLITIIANLRGLNDAAAVGIVEKAIGLLFVVPSSMLATVSTLAAAAIGGDQPVRARRILRGTLYVTWAFGLMIGVAMQWLAEPTVAVFTDSPEVVCLGGQYLRSYSWDCLLAGTHFCFSGFFCACGLASISFAHNAASIILARVPLSYLFSAAYPDTLYPMGWAVPIGSALSVVICVVCYLWLLRRRPTS